MTPDTLDTVTQSVFTQLDGLGVSRFIVAYSGGLDSTFLLYLLMQYADARQAVQFRALHVDHGDLFASGIDYAGFCQHWCNRHGIDLTMVRLHIEERGGASREQIAREYRYAAFCDELAEHEVLLLAHHADDQLETLLLRLNRGAGLCGLTSIPKMRQLGRSQLFRPLLDIERGVIETLAKACRLNWIEDPTNMDNTVDRNFIRHEIIGRLRLRWPDLARRWQMSLTLLQEQKRAIEWLCQQQLEHLDTADTTLPVGHIRSCPFAVQKALVTVWLQRHGVGPLRKTVLEEIVRRLVLPSNSSARVDVLDCHGTDLSLRGYRNVIYLLARHQLHIEREYTWDPHEQLVLPHGVLSAHVQSGEVVPARMRWQVRFRAFGGTRLAIRVSGKKHSTQLTKLFQQQAIPPWQREYVPLIFDDDGLIAVAGLAIDQRLLDCTASLRIDWQPKYRLVCMADD